MGSFAGGACGGSPGFGGLMATACNDGKVRVWELPSGRVLRELATPKLPLPLAFSHSDALLATVSNGDRPDERGVVQVWEWKSGRQVFRQETKKECRDLAMPARQCASCGGESMSKAAILELENQRSIMATRAVEFAAQKEKQQEQYEEEILRLKGIIAAQAETINELQAKGKEAAEADGA